MPHIRLWVRYIISQQAYDSLQYKTKIHQGQHINLVQVTGKTTISGYVPLNLYFPTEHGPVELLVEAYVVKGMTTLFILGNDFADQYALSLIRRDSKSFVVFSSSGRETEVFNSVGTLFIDNEGHTFRITTRTDSRHTPSKLTRHQQAK